MAGTAAMKVSLRPIDRGDAAWVDTWIEDAARPVGYDVSSRRRRGTQVRLIVRDRSRAGVLVYRRGAGKRGDAYIDLVATPSSEGRRGVGMAAAAVVEDELRAGGVRRVYAPAVAKHGISMYFWIRLGYRPLLRDAWPCEREGVAWLVREI